MPSAVSETTLELEIASHEASPPTAESYPYPALTPTGSVERRSVPAVVLENASLKAIFVPALGGRLLSLFDKHAARELLHRGPGATGLEIHLNGRPRPTAEAEVAFAGHQSDDGSAGLWMAEAVTGSGTSWHLHVRLPEDRASLEVEARVFNRSFTPVATNAGLLLPGDVAKRGEFATWTDDVAIVSRDLGAAGTSRHGLVLSRFDQDRHLAPRQLDTWNAILLVGDFKGAAAVSGEAVLFVDDGRVRLEPLRDLAHHKLVLLDPVRGTLEAVVSLRRDEPQEFALPGAVDGVALLDPHGSTVLKWERANAPFSVAERIARPDPAGVSVDWIDAPAPTLQDATFDVSTRHIARTVLGMRALAAGDLETADREFEQALLYNAEDALLWWMKAIVKRRAGTEGGIPELLNAHYLAPLEPALRAESFLAQPQSLSRDPNPLLAPLAGRPEDFVEVAALLLEAVLYEDAARWIDESLRHRDVAILRCLLAYAHLRASGLDAEAAEQLRLAANLPAGPPYPWRPIERKALQALASRFPGDAFVREISSGLRS